MPVTSITREIEMFETSDGSQFMDEDAADDYEVLYQWEKGIAELYNEAVEHCVDSSSKDQIFAKRVIRYFNDDYPDLIYKLFREGRIRRILDESDLAD